MIDLFFDDGLTVNLTCQKGGFETMYVDLCNAYDVISSVNGEGVSGRDLETLCFFLLGDASKSSGGGLRLCASDSADMGVTGLALTAWRVLEQTEGCASKFSACTGCLTSKLALELNSRSSEKCERRLTEVAHSIDEPL